MTTAREIAEGNTILRGVVGSTVHGLAIAETDDRDEMGICLEPPECVVGLQHFEQYVYRTQPEGVRSGPGDLDLVVYSLRKWARLAKQGNPTVLVLLFVPDELLVICNKWGRWLRASASLFTSRAAGPRFLGYLAAQKQRLLGERGQLRVTRTELVERHGYDTKYAGHMLRLGYQGIEFLETGWMTLPSPEPLRSYLLSVRRGEVALQDVLTCCGKLEVQLRDLCDTSPLPPEPAHTAIDALLLELYTSWWATLQVPGLGGLKREEHGNTTT